MRAGCPSKYNNPIILFARLHITSLQYLIFGANPTSSPIKHVMSAGVQPPTKQLISQNAYIVKSSRHSPDPLTLTSQKGNDKYFLRHRCHFRCRKSLHTDPLPQADQRGRLLLLHCSVGTHPRSCAFLLLHRTLVRG